MKIQILIVRYIINVYIFNTAFTSDYIDYIFLAIWLWQPHGRLFCIPLDAGTSLRIYVRYSIFTLERDYTSLKTHTHKVKTSTYCQCVHTKSTWKKDTWQLIHDRKIIWLRKLSKCEREGWAEKMRKEDGGVWRMREWWETESLEENKGNGGEIREGGGEKMVQTVNEN